MNLINPWTIQAGAQGLKFLGGLFQRGEDEKARKEMARQQNVGNLIGALSAGRIGYTPSVQRKESGIGSFLSGIGNVAQIGGQLYGGYQAAQQALGQQDLQNQLSRQAIQQGQNQLEQQAGQGKFFQQQALKAPEKARQMSVVEQGPTLANLQAPQMLQQGRQEAIQNTNPIGAMQALGFGQAQQTARANELAEVGQMQGMDVQNRRVGLDERQLDLQESAYALKSRQFNASLKNAMETPLLSPKDVMDQENKLRTEFTGLTKDFTKIRDSYSRILAVSEEPSAAGDLALIFNYMKMLDPGSVVRESEFATAQNAGSVPEAVRNTYNRLLSGERLGETRMDFITQARNLFESQRTMLDEMAGNYRNIAERQGLDVSNVIFDMNFEPLKLKADDILKRFSLPEPKRAQLVDIPGVGAYSIEEIQKELQRREEEENLKYIGRFTTGFGAR